MEELLVVKRHPFRINSMEKMMPGRDDRFTNIATDLLVNVRDLVNWGIETGNTTPDKIRLTVAARREAAIKLIESGMSQRQAAKILGCPESTLRLTLRNSCAGSAQDLRTGSAETRERRAAVAARAASGGVTAAPTEKYRIIYADPPWDYGNPDYRSAPQDHYPVMRLEEICAVPVKDWVEDDAISFLWVPPPLLEKAFAVIRAWSFDYKENFVWDKIKHNMGYYHSVRHEHLLIGTRGACRPDQTILFDSVQSIERGKHSEKPVEFYDIIETLYTHGRRLELFARRKREGWDAYGHVVEMLDAGE
jgi:N6-adenosine-specific RNA methylase IME4